MKVVQISTFDTYGGAARAAYRHHKALLAAGINSKMLVQRKQSDDVTVDKPKSLLDKLRSRVWETGSSTPLRLSPPKIHPVVAGLAKE